LLKLFPDVAVLGFLL